MLNQLGNHNLGIYWDCRILIFDPVFLVKLHFCIEKAFHLQRFPLRYGKIFYIDLPNLVCGCI